MLKKKITLISFIVVFLLGFLVRLYRFDNPVADWHSWRQADTAAVTWNFVHTSFDVLHPQYFDISNVQSGMDNPHGYRFVEFPIYNAVTAGLYLTFHTLTLEEWGRLVTIVSGLAGSLFLFLLVRRRVNTMTAWFVLIFSLFLPFNIYYGRTILPDASMVSMLLASIFFLDKWLDGFRGQQKKSHFGYLLLATLCMAVSLLLKPYALFYGLAMFVLVFSVFRWKTFLRWELWLFTILSVLPLAVWRVWMLQYPEGIPASSWLFNGNGIRFHPAFFRWIFYERLTKLIAGYVGDIAILAGVIGMLKNTKERWFFGAFIVSALLYLFVIATGNVQHDYYQIVIMPAVAVIMGFGSVFLLQFLQKRLPQRAAYGIVILLIISGFWLSWLQVRDYFNINNIAIVHAGRAIRQITPPTAKILAPYNGDTTLLYYTKRKGWPSFEHDLETLRMMGADYLALVNPKPTDYALAKQYKLVSSSKDYLLFDLHKKL